MNRHLSRKEQRDQFRAKVYALMHPEDDMDEKIQRESNENSNALTDDWLRRELEAKFDELFGPIGSDG